MGKMNAAFHEYMQMIGDCNDREEQLTDWERSFIDSVQHQLESEHGSGLTPKQCEKIDDIWERVTKRG